MTLFYERNLSATIRVEEHDVSDHFRRGRFHNLGDANGQPLWKVPRMLFESGTPWPRHVPVTPQRPPVPATDSDIVVTFIGHATFLIATTRGNIVIDPVFTDRAGPFGVAGPRRVRQPGVRFDDLPPISLILLSHNHYDHCDLRALRAIQEREARRTGAPYALKPPVVTLLGNGPLLRSAGVERIEEIDWWQEASSLRREEAAEEGPYARVTATPAQHFSARTPFDRNRALWGGFVIQLAERRIFFAADSGYGKHFSDVGRRLGPIDLALLPIGAYEPRWFMKDIHMNPDEAVKAHLDLGARRSIGMHFGTFPLTIEGIDEPVAALARARAASGVAADRFVTLDVGSSIHL